MEKKWSKLQVGESVRSKIALAEAIIFGVSAVSGMAYADTSIKCSEIDYQVEFNVNPEYNEAFKKLINSNRVQSLSSLEYSVLAEYVVKTQERIARNLKNGLKITIDDTYNFSSEINDKYGRKINNEMHEKVVEIYDGAFLYDKNISKIKPNSVAVATDLINDLIKFVKDNKNSLPEGSRWVLKNATVTYLTEIANLYASLGINLGVEVDGITKDKFIEMLFSVFDKNEWIEKNKLVPRKDIDINAVLSTMCQCPLKAFIDTVLQIIDLTKTVNEEFNINRCGNIGAVIIDDGGIYVIGNGSAGRDYMAQTVDGNYRVSRRV